MIEKEKACGCPCIQRMLSRSYPDEKCIAVSPDSGLFRQVSRLVKYADPRTESDTERKCTLMEMASLADHNIALISGGNNGSPDWPKYLLDIHDIMEVLGQAGFDAWIIKLDNDCPDDVHYVYIGLRKIKPKAECCDNAR